MSQLHRPSDLSLFMKMQQRLKKTAQKASYASRYHEFRLKGRHPLRLLGTPRDPWAGSMAAGTHILARRFCCDGQVLRNPDDATGAWSAADIWQAPLAGNWPDHLHSFVWLRDLNRVVDRKAARLRAIDLTACWLATYDQWHDRAWAPDLTGRRIINWMAYAPLIFDSSDLAYRSRLLDCLARQARHLYLGGDEPLRGLPRLQAVCGMIMAGLYIPYGEPWLKRGRALLERAMAAEIAPDGGLSSRNPQDAYQALRDFLMMRAACLAMGHSLPPGLDDAIGRFAAHLRLLRHGDGGLALFNGAREQQGPEITAALKLAATVTAKPGPVPAPDVGNSGFRRLDQGGTVVLLDGGPPAETAVSGACHAGTLALEMSRGGQRIIVNCGSAPAVGPAGGGTADAGALGEVLRATAAHSTLVLEDKNSSEIRKDGCIGRGPTRVASHITRSAGHSLLDCSHDGYVAAFGLLHRRLVYLNDRGEDLRGEDRLSGAPSRGAPPLRFDVRFHIHPDVTLLQQEADNRLLLRLPGRECWRFLCSGAAVTLEDSLYFGAGSHPLDCRQIRLSGSVMNVPGAAAGTGDTVIKWSLCRIEGPR